MAIHSGKLLQPRHHSIASDAAAIGFGRGYGFTGLGWDFETVTVVGKQTTGHDGELLGGISLSLLALPEHGIAVSVISNISYADTFSLALKIAEVFVQRQVDETQHERHHQTAKAARKSAAPLF
jgi:hypothetical protein